MQTESRLTYSEDRSPDEWVLCDELLVQYEGDHSHTTNSQRNESAPAVPWILNTFPRDRNQKARRGREEKRHTNPVDFLELTEKGAVLYVELEEESDQDGANAEKGKVDPKDPTPADILCEATTYTFIGIKCPSRFGETYQAKVLLQCPQTTSLRRS